MEREAHGTESDTGGLRDRFSLSQVRTDLDRCMDGAEAQKGEQAGRVSGAKSCVVLLKREARGEGSEEELAGDEVRDQPLEGLAGSAQEFRVTL